MKITTFNPQIVTKDQRLSSSCLKSWALRGAIRKKGLVNWMQQPVE